MAKMSQCCFNEQMTRPIPNYTALWATYIDSIFKLDTAEGLIAEEIYRHVAYTKSNAAKKCKSKEMFHFVSVMMNSDVKLLDLDTF